MPVLPLAALLALLLPASALAQGVTPYDTYRTPYGEPDYQGNLTPLPDDSALLGPLPGEEMAASTGPARDFGEIADIDADYRQWRTDRLHQIQGTTGRLDAQRLATDAERRRFSGNGPDTAGGASALPPSAAIQPYPPLYGQGNDLLTAPSAAGSSPAGGR